MLRGTYTLLSRERSTLPSVGRDIAYLIHIVRKGAMKVEELIELLKVMPQDAYVVYTDGYDQEYGPTYRTPVGVVCEPVGWDDYNDGQIVEVFIE